MLMHGLKVIGLVIATAGTTLDLKVGDTYPAPALVCDTVEAASSILDEDGVHGYAAGEKRMLQLRADGVCRGMAGPFRIDSVKQHSVQVQAGEAVVVKMSKGDKVYWGLLIDVDVKEK